MKIQIIGYSGSGKSTLAKILAKHYRIPRLHLDNVQFLGNWQTRPMATQQQMVRDFLEQNENWVIDGNYHHLAPERFEMADLTIFLDYGRWYCFKKAWQRYRKYQGTCRDSCNSPEKFDFEFARWILFDGRRKNIRLQNRKILAMAKESRHFKNVRELHQYLEKLNIQPEIFD